MKKYILGIIAVIIAAGLSAFTTIQTADQSDQSEFYWYVVDYSDPNGVIPFGATPTFGGAMKSQAYAIANDICEDEGQRHCLRGVSNPFDPEELPTYFYEETTPRPNN